MAGRENKTPAPAPSGGASGKGPDLGAQIELAMAKNEKLKALRNRVVSQLAAMIDKDPQRVAAALRGWIHQDLLGPK